MKKSPGIKKRMVVTTWFSLLLAGLFASGAIQAAVTLFPNLPSGQPVGTAIGWIAFTENSNNYDYRLSIGRPGTTPRVVYDFSARRFFEWTAIEDGIYNVIVTARERGTGTISLDAKTFTVASRVGSQPIITGTDHPLVALYSAPPCPAGNQMRVQFLSVFPQKYFATPFKSCDGIHSMNFYLGGMLAERLHLARGEERDEFDNLVAFGPLLSHQTGSLPEGLAGTFPFAFGDEQTSVADSVMLLSPLPSSEGLPVPVATDLVGRVLWYYDDPAVSAPQVWRPVAGGTFLINFEVFDFKGQGLREVDLAGNVIRETTAKRLTEQLVKAGQDPLTSIHHEAVRLPNGHTAILGSVERLLNDVQGAQGVVDVVGDYVVVLDEDWQIAWSWNSFDHLDIERVAVLGEACGNEPPNDAGCPPVFLVDGVTTLANDWTHGNSVTYSPADGNLIVSMRHQDWVIKLDYQDGNGNGAVVWRLGPDGDFSIDSADPFPWISHQHDANYISDNRIVVYDNGNTRCAGATDLCPSRGQVYELDEVAMTATLVLNADLGVYSFALGSAQQLSNGNYHFDSGLLVGPDGQSSLSTEVLPDATLNYSLGVNMPAYRSFRLIDLYSVPGG